MIKLYIFLIYFIQPIIWIYLLWNGNKNPEYLKRWGERYGFCKEKVKPNSILIHAASLGESIAAKPLIIILKKKYPFSPIIVTNVTPNGSKYIKNIFDKKVYNVYFPYDYPKSIKRFLNFTKPILVIIMEREIWPNFIRETYFRKIPLIIANARLSENSYIKYKFLGKFMKNILNLTSLIAAQSYMDGERFIKLGVNKSKLFITGNLKFNISIDNKLKKKIKNLKNQFINKNPIWIAASTHKGEENILLKIHLILSKYFPNLLLIIAPRHPERYIELCNIAKKIGLNYFLQSNKNILYNDENVIIVDTTGELMLLYGISDLAFIGGSMINHGGHNPLEAAVHSIPIIIGPYHYHFDDICKKLIKENGLIVVNNYYSLIKKIFFLLNNNKTRLFYGKNALKVFKKNKNNLEKLLVLIENYLSN